MSQEDVTTTTKRLQQKAPLTPGVRINSIIEDAAFAYGVDPHDVRWKKLAGWKQVPNWKNILDARRDALAQIVAEFPAMSYPQLGRLFGCDHTTIWHHLMEIGLPPRKRAKGGAE